MGPELNIPKIDVKENWGEDINNTKDNLVKEINDILDNNEKINNLGKMLDKKFLEWITPEVAQKIIKAIPENLQNDEDVKNVITVLNAKISIAGNDNKIQNTKLDSVDTTNFIVDLSQYKKDISGHSEQYGLTWLNWEIWQCLLLINWSNNFQNLKNNLEEISKILDWKTAKLEDLNKIENFLKNNHVDVESWTQTNIQPLLKWIHVFLSRIAPTLQANKQNQKNADKILDEHEQKIKAQKEKENLERLQSQEKLINMATSFSELKDKIPNDLKNLSKLNKKDIQNIKDFINKLPVTTTFPYPKTEIFDLYIKMYQCQQILDSKNLTHRDKDNFNEIFNEISKTYENDNKKAISTYALWRWFGNVDQASLQHAAPKDWDGKNLSENDSYVQTACRWRIFSPKQYVGKFNALNKERIENNIEQLKNFNIKTVFTEEELNKFSIQNIQATNNSATLFKYWNTELGLDNLISTLNLADKAKEQWGKDPWSTNFANEDELIQLINDNDGIKKKWLNDIFHEIESRNQPLDNVETVTQEQEASLEELTLTEDSILKFFSQKYIIKDNLIDFFDEVKAKDNLTEDQKKLLHLMHKWLTTEREEKDGNTAYDAVKELQSKLWFQNDEVDWKFGITTFNKLKEIFWMAIKHNEGRKQNEVKNNTIDEVKKNINTDNYSTVLEIINGWIWERQITFEYNSNISFLINKNICTLKNNWKTYLLKKTNVDRKFQLNNNYLEFLPTWIYITITEKNKNNVYVYKPNWDTFHGTLKSNEYWKWKLYYKWWGSFEWTFENWKEKCWIRKNNRWTRLEYNGKTNYYLDISKSWEITYSQRFNIWPVNPYTKTTALKMRLDEQGDNINLDGDNRIIKINKKTHTWTGTRKSNDYTYLLPEEWCKLVCEQMNELTNK